MEVELRWSSEKLEQKAYALEKINKQLFECVKQTTIALREDPFCGTYIPKRLVPKKWKQYANIRKINLLQGWRLFYHIAYQDPHKIIIIISFMSHKEYERLFRY